MVCQCVSGFYFLHLHTSASSTGRGCSQLTTGPSNTDLHRRRCSLLARVDGATKLDVTYKVDLCRSPHESHAVCGVCHFPNPPSHPASLPVPAALLSPLSVCSSRCAYFSYPLFTSPSSSPVSTPSPSPTHSDIIVRIPTLLPWHTLEHRAYHALPSTRSHISFFFFFAVTIPPSSLFPPHCTHLVFVLVFLMFLIHLPLILPLTRSQIVTRADYRNCTHGSGSNLSLCLNVQTQAEVRC